MRIRETIVRAGFLSAAAIMLLAPSEARAQVPPFAQRDQNWTTASNITTLVGVGIVSLMPRIYYNDPEATVGWKARWHTSFLAPIMTMTALTLLVDGPIKNAIKDPRPGCTIDNTGISPGGLGCDSFGMPSTQAFASWGATGAGTAVFLVDTFRYSQSKFHAGSFIGNIAVPLVLSVFTSAARAQAPGGPPVYAQEDVGQIVAGTLSGFVVGGLLGLGYALAQRPNCGYGGHIICW